ncbi:MAG: hypothetical protein AMXMBFR13_18300 [Phycisphaerae bacterium]
MSKAAKPRKGRKRQTAPEQLKKAQPPKAPKRQTPPVPTAEPPPPDPQTEHPLARTAVFRLLPGTTRAKVDNAILTRPQGLGTLEAIAHRFELQEKFGITMAALKTYARRLERALRPMATGEVVTGILGCLPVSYRRRLLAGNEVLLLSRVSQSLSGESHQPVLPVSDLARLAVVLKSLANRLGRVKTAGSGRGGGKQEANGAIEPSNLGAAISKVYGLDWPPRNLDESTKEPDAP